MKFYLIFLTKVGFLICLLTTKSVAGITKPTPTNVLAKIASATSYSSNNNNNIDFKNSTAQTSGTISFSDLKTNISQDAQQLCLEVDQEALDRLSSSTEASLAGIDNLGDAKGFEDTMRIPDKTPETYVYDTEAESYTPVKNTQIETSIYF